MGYSQSKFTNYKIYHVTTKNAEYVKGDLALITEKLFLNKTARIEKFGDHVTLFLPGQTFHLKRDYRYKDFYGFLLNRKDKFSDILIAVLGLDKGDGKINIVLEEIYNLSELGFGENAYEVRLFAKQLIN